MTATLTTSQAADIVGVNPLTVLRFCIERGLPSVRGRGYAGRQYRLDEVDIRVLRALHVINGGRGDGGVDTRDLCAHAEHAIRKAPHRWLLAHVDGADTFHTAEDAGRAWDAMTPRPASWLIDLEPDCG